MKKTHLSLLFFVSIILSSCNSALTPIKNSSKELLDFYRNQIRVTYPGVSNYEISLNEKYVIDTGCITYTTPNAYTNFHFSTGELVKLIANGGCFVSEEITPNNYSYVGCYLPFYRINEIKQKISDNTYVLDDKKFSIDDNVIDFKYLVTLSQMEIDTPNVYDDTYYVRYQKNEEVIFSNESYQLCGIIKEVEVKINGVINTNESRTDFKYLLCKGLYDNGIIKNINIISEDENCFANYDYYQKQHHNFGKYVYVIPRRINNFHNLPLGKVGFFGAPSYSTYGYLDDNFLYCPVCNGDKTLTDITDDELKELTGGYYMEETRECVVEMINYNINGNVCDRIAKINLVKLMNLIGGSVQHYHIIK